MGNEKHQKVIRKIGGPYGRALGKFDRGGKLGRRARAIVASFLGHSEADVLWFLKRRHIVPVSSALETTDQMIARGIKMEQGIGRKDHQVTWEQKKERREYYGNFCPISYVQKLRDHGRGDVLGLPPSRFVTSPSNKFQADVMRGSR